MELSISVKESGKGARIWELGDGLGGKATMSQTKRFLQNAQISIAETALKEEQLKGFDKNPRVRTDNKWGKDPREVKFMGKIEYYSRQNIGEALIEAYKIIVARSPIVTGQYVSSHYVYLNAKKIATSQGELYVWLRENEATLKNNDVVRIVNVTPYASRIEMRGGRRGTVGKNKGKNVSRVRKKSIGGLSVTQSNGAYVLAARAINARFKAQGRINFQMLPNGFGGVSVVPTGRFRTTYIEDNKRSKSKRKRFSGPYVFPSVVFRIAGEGIQ